MEAVLSRDPGWISFSLSSARWIPFSVDPSIQAAFSDPADRNQDMAELERWLRRAETSLFHWIIEKIVERKGRADLFRALGRGWIFIFLLRKKEQFKWWFESVERVLSTHQTDIDKLGLAPQDLQKYTTGYNCEAELVFLLKGIVPKTASSPIISIQRIAENWKQLDMWNSSEQVQEALKLPNPTDAERRAHAARAEKRKAAARRKKERSAATARASQENNLADPQDEFQQLLDELKSQVREPWNCQKKHSLAYPTGTVEPDML